MPVETLTLPPYFACSSYNTRRATSLAASAADACDPPLRMISLALARAAAVAFWVAAALASLLVDDDDAAVGAVVVADLVFFDEVMFASLVAASCWLDFLLDLGDRALFPLDLRTFIVIVRVRRPVNYYYMYSVLVL